MAVLSVTKMMTGIGCNVGNSDDGGDNVKSMVDRRDDTDNSDGESGWEEVENASLKPTEM